MFLLANTEMFKKTIFKTCICLLIHHQMNMRALRKVWIYLIKIMTLPKKGQIFLLDGDYLTLKFMLTFLRKHLSGQLLVFINDLPLLLGQHNRCCFDGYLFFYRKVSAFYTVHTVGILYTRRVNNRPWHTFDMC